jgi:hypothetical protein
VGTGASYTPSTAAPGTTYYYVVATNTLDGSASSATSSVATVTVNVSTDVTGGTTLVSGGTYQIAAGASGIITIATSEAVTLVGRGEAESFGALSVDCSVADVNLTVQDLYISGLSGNTPAVDFLGGSNALTIGGTSAFNVSAGTGFSPGSGSMIHVPSGSSLTLGGDGTLYMYKTGGGASIGGNYGETNGAITFNGGPGF